MSLGCVGSQDGARWVLDTRAAQTVGGGYATYNASTGAPAVAAPSRGQPAAELDAAAPIVLHWYLAVPDGLTIVAPDVAVHAWLRSDDGPGGYADSHGIRSGPQLAEGETVGTLAGPLTEALSGSGVTYQRVDGMDVYGFEVSLKPTGRFFPTHGVQAEVTASLRSPLCDGAQSPTLAGLGPYSSEGYRPRIELSTLNPLKLLSAHATASEGIRRIVLTADMRPAGDVHAGTARADTDPSQLITVELASPWGCGDVGPVALASAGAPQLVAVLAPAHMHPLPTCTFNFHWNPSGDLVGQRLHLTAANVQGTAHLTAVLAYVDGGEVPVAQGVPVDGVQVVAVRACSSTGNATC